MAVRCRRGVDHEAVVPAVREEVAGEDANGLGSEPPTALGTGNEDVDAGVSVVGVEVLVVLDQTHDLVVELDHEPPRVAVDRPEALGSLMWRARPPPAGDVGLVGYADELFQVAPRNRPEYDSLSRNDLHRTESSRA